jgi:hypothetical protein
VDNSDFSPNRLTATIDSPYPYLSRSSPFLSFQAARIFMTFQIYVFLLVFFLILSLALLWRHCWLPRQPSPSKAGTVRTTVQRLLKPRTPLDCPSCRLASTPSPSVRSAPRLVRPWSEVKSRRGAPKRIPTAGFACPNQQCPYFGITDAHIHALVGDGKHGRAERIQTFRCQACRTTFSARRHTPLYRLKTPSRAYRKGPVCAGRRARPFRRRAGLRLPASHHHQPF